MAEDLFEKHIVWAERLARHFQYRYSVPYHFQDDINQASLIGLMEASRRFDGTATFKSFAAMRMWGEMKDQWLLIKNPVWVPKAIDACAKTRWLEIDGMEADTLGLKSRATSVLDEMEIEEEAARFLESLTPLEIFIIQKIRLGEFLKKIGEELEVSESRVSQIVASTMAKFMRARQAH